MGKPEEKGKAKSEEKGKATATVGPQVPQPVEVIFVADYRKAADVPVAEVDTPRLLLHAHKQKKRNESLKPSSVKTYVFTVKTMGDIRAKLEKEVKSSEIVKRIDFLMHGNRTTAAFSGEVIVDDVLFDVSTGTTFGDFFAFFTLSGWDSNGQLDPKAQFWKTAVDWQKAVKGRLTSDAEIYLFACHSGGEDTDTLAILQEGELLKATARLFGTPATGFTGYLFWTAAGTANIYAKIPGVPTTDPKIVFHSRFRQADKDLEYYRDLETLKRKGFPGVSMAITRSG